VIERKKTGFGEFKRIRSGLVHMWLSEKSVLVLLALKHIMAYTSIQVLVYLNRILVTTRLSVGRNVTNEIRSGHSR